ncbi:thermonuclease family protein [Naasia lichenicola]|uniref:TNase-like domain-containing protein n=1 Tax=Naasia lichenicola TaxID=2565933 RepID=A0A4S4FSD5_9MICO|nr:thermonuclease family protein [Naasia lichenicola]THG33208.1 hypothetical protein E6C64_02310 [Naasia lichenicola]
MRLPRGAQVALAVVLVAVAAWFVLSNADREITPTPGRAPVTIPQSPAAGSGSDSDGSDSDGYGSATGLIDRVVDGDTVIVDIDGESDDVRVRMLNVNAPESVKPDSPVECLGPEASAFTKSLLSEGDEVTLEFDAERYDQYGRTLASVITADGENVGVELARAGLARAVSYDGNERFRPAVDDAIAEARADRVGLFDPANGC